MFDQIVTDIKDLKIQGAINIAKKALEALHEKSASAASIEALQQAALILEETRPTEPALRNVVRWFLKELSPDRANRNELYEKIIGEIQDSLEKVTSYGASMIENGMTLFTHCHSSSVTAAIMRAYDEGKRFEVYNSETRPRFQGRKTALELAGHGIHVHHMVDNAAFHILKKVDLFFFGADAVNSYGNVFNKVGTKTYAETVKRYDGKTFSLTSGIKYDVETKYGVHEEIEKRASLEVWDTEKKNITIFNPAFDEVEKEYIDGIVSEFGVLAPESFVQEARKMLE